MTTTDKGGVEWIRVVDKRPMNGEPVNTMFMLESDRMSGDDTVEVLIRYAGLWVLPDHVTPADRIPTHWSRIK